MLLSLGLIVRSGTTPFTSCIKGGWPPRRALLSYVHKSEDIRIRSSCCVSAWSAALQARVLRCVSSSTKLVRWNLTRTKHGTVQNPRWKTRLAEDLWDEGGTTRSIRRCFSSPWRAPWLPAARISPSDRLHVERKVGIRCERASCARFACVWDGTSAVLFARRFVVDRRGRVAIESVPSVWIDAVVVVLATTDVTSHHKSNESKRTCGRSDSKGERRDTTQVQKGHGDVQEGEKESVDAHARRWLPCKLKWWCGPSGRSGSSAADSGS